MPDENAVAKAYAVYTPFTLSIYDTLVHGLSNRFAWRCPASRLIGLRPRFAHVEIAQEGRVALFRAS